MAVTMKTVRTLVCMRPDGSGFEIDENDGGVDMVMSYPENADAACEVREEQQVDYGTYDTLEAIYGQDIANQAQQAGELHAPIPTRSASGIPIAPTPNPAKMILPGGGNYNDQTQSLIGGDSFLSDLDPAVIAVGGLLLLLYLARQ